MMKVIVRSLLIQSIRRTRRALQHECRTGRGMDKLADEQGARLEMNVSMLFSVASPVEACLRQGRLHACRRGEEVASI